MYCENVTNDHVTKELMKMGIYIDKCQVKLSSCGSSYILPFQFEVLLIETTFDIQDYESSIYASKLILTPEIINQHPNYIDVFVDGDCISMFINIKHKKQYFNMWFDYDVSTVSGTYDCLTQYGRPYMSHAINIFFNADILKTPDVKPNRKELFKELKKLRKLKKYIVSDIQYTNRLLKSGLTKYLDKRTNRHIYFKNMIRIYNIYEEF